MFYLPELKLIIEKHLVKQRVKKELQNEQNRLTTQSESLDSTLAIPSRKERMVALRQRHFRLINQRLQHHAERVGKGMRKAIDATVTDR